MPFDGLDFKAAPKQPPRAPPGERVFLLLFLLVAIASLVLPISLAGLADFAEYLCGN